MYTPERLLTFYNRSLTLQVINKPVVTYALHVGYSMLIIKMLGEVFRKVKLNQVRSLSRKELNLKYENCKNYVK